MCSFSPSNPRFVQQLVQRPPPPVTKPLVQQGGFRTPRHINPHNGLEHLRLMDLPSVADRPTSLSVTNSSSIYNSGDQQLLYYPAPSPCFNTIASGYHTPPSGLACPNPTQLHPPTVPSPQLTPSPTPSGPPPVGQPQHTTQLHGGSKQQGHLPVGSQSQYAQITGSPQLPSGHQLPCPQMPTGQQLGSLTGGPHIPGPHLPGPPHPQSSGSVDSPHSCSPQPVLVPVGPPTGPPSHISLPVSSCCVVPPAPCTCSNCAGSNSSSSSNSSNPSNGGERGGGPIPPYNPPRMMSINMPPIRNGLIANPYAAYLHAALSADLYRHMAHTTRYNSNYSLSATQNAQTNYLLHQRGEVPFYTRHKSQSHPSCHNCGQFGHIANECHEKTMEALTPGNHYSMILQIILKYVMILNSTFNICWVTQTEIVVNLD